MPATISYHTHQLKLKLHNICVCIKRVCFESSTLQPRPPKQKNSVKNKWMRRKLEESQCLAPRLWNRGTAELGMQLESPALPGLCHAALPPCRQLQEDARLHSLASAPLVNNAAFSKQTNKNIFAVSSSLLTD